MDLCTKSQRKCQTSCDTVYPVVIKVIAMEALVFNIPTYDKTASQWFLVEISATKMKRFFKDLILYLSNSVNYFYRFRYYIFLDDTRVSDGGTSPVSKISITFRELHNSYGRPILKDFNVWKHEQKEKVDNNVENLITLWVDK